MKIDVVRKGLSAFLWLAACAAVGCGSSPGSTTTGGEGGGSGGTTTGSGGTRGSGGVPGSGGTAQSGGTTGTGGNVGSGGATSLGGTMGSGGVASGGGAKGQGGYPATGGAPGQGGAAGATATGGALGIGGTMSGQAVSIFDGTTLNGWMMNPAGAYSVNATDGAIASTGGKRAFIYYAANKASFYRVIYSVRQVHRVDHDPGVIFFGTDPTKDALGGVMFALPDSWGWDYRNGASKATGTAVGKVPNVNVADWARCELLVNAATGTARAACAQPVGAKAVEVLRFQDAKTPNVPSYFAIQCHTGGQVDEYKDITMEVNPAVNDLITTK